MAKEMIIKSGQRSVPVIAVDDELVVGFDEEKLEELLSG
jgi:glutaredoxin